LQENPFQIGNAHWRDIGSLSHSIKSVSPTLMHPTVLAVVVVLYAIVGLLGRCEVNKAMALALYPASVGRILF